MSYPPEWPAPGKLHFRLVNDRLGSLDLDCDHGYVVTAFNLGFPDIREVKLNNSLDDGVFDVTRFFGARAVTLDMVLKTHVGLTPASMYLNSEAYLRDRLLGYLYPGIRSRLLFSEHGDQRVRQILIRGANASLAVNKPNYNRVNASWLAPRGTLYSYDESCYTYRFSETAVATSMDQIIVNEGTVPVDWRASISGYTIHPRFILNGTEVLQLQYTAEPGDVITLDSFSRTVTINGKPATYTYGTNAPKWFTIPPGASTLTVQYDGVAFGAAGYPYARWQAPISAATVDTFERANGDLGPTWETPSVLPASTVAVDLAIDAGEVIVTEPDDGVGPREWGFARNVAAITAGDGSYAEIDVTNLIQSAVEGPVMRSKVELYTNMNDADAACQALTVDLDYGIAVPPPAPVIFADPFETIDWTMAGSGIGLVGAGRNGKAIQITGTSGSLTYDLPVGDESPIVVVGIAFKITASAITSVRSLLEFRSDAGLHGGLAVDIGGSLYATDAAGVNRGGSPLGSVTPNTWHYAEVRYVMSATIGEFALRLNGVNVAGVFGIDTRTGSVTKIRIPPPNPVSGGTHTYDDFYLATGDSATFVGPLDVANGSLAWKLHRYAADGSEGHVASSGTLPFGYDTGSVRLRLESASDGMQRFLLDGDPIAEVDEATPAVGTLAGFGASYETFTYGDVDADFTDDFERAALGTEWTLPPPRAGVRTNVLPVISAGAAVAPPLTAVYPQKAYSVSASGTSLSGGAAQTMPFNTAGHLMIARVVQDAAFSTPHTASTGWTQLGAAALGTAAGDFMEAFDNLGSWGYPAGSAATLVAPGRGGAGSLARITGVLSSNYIHYTLPTPNATVVVGFAHRINSLAAATSEIAQFYGDFNVTQHNRLTVGSDGSLTFWRSTASALGASAAGVIAVNTWNYIEVSVTLSDTVGAVIVRVNGTEVLNLTARDTKNAGTATAYSTVRLSGPIASFYNEFDDLYLMAGAAAFKGDQTVAASSGAEQIRMSCFARVSDGTSNDALTLTGAAKEYVTAIESYWIGTAGFASTIIPQLKFAVASGITGLPDPPAISIGARRNWLFLASTGFDSPNTSPGSVTSPTSYDNIHGTTISPGGLVAAQSGNRAAATEGTENPATFTGAGLTARPWIAMTVGIPGEGPLWAGAENVTQFDASSTIAVEAVVGNVASSGAPLVELYTHMVTGSPACRVLQIELVGRTWKMGHYAAVGDDLIVAASGSLPAGAFPFTVRLEGDPNGTERFLFNGSLVQAILDATAPNPTGPTQVGFGEFWTSPSTSSPQIRSLSAVGVRFATNVSDSPTSPRIERFAGGALSGTNWAIPQGVFPPNNPAPGGKPPWAWSAPIDPLTGEPSILTVHFCFFSQWL